MPLTDNDNYLTHIQYLSSTQLICTFLKRREVHPFDFVAVLRYHASFYADDWIVTNVEILSNE